MSYTAAIVSAGRRLIAQKEAMQQHRGPDAVHSSSNCGLVKHADRNSQHPSPELHQVDSTASSLQPGSARTSSVRMSAPPYAHQHASTTQPEVHDRPAPMCGSSLYFVSDVEQPPTVAQQQSYKLPVQQQGRDTRRPKHEERMQVQSRDSSTFHTGQAINTYIVPRVNRHSCPSPTLDQEMIGITKADTCICHGTYQHEIFRRDTTPEYMEGDRINVPVGPAYNPHHYYARMERQQGFYNQDQMPVNARPATSQHVQYIEHSSEHQISGKPGNSGSPGKAGSRRHKYHNSDRSETTTRAKLRGYENSSSSSSDDEPEPKPAKSHLPTKRYRSESEHRYSGKPGKTGSRQQENTDDGQPEPVSGQYSEHRYSGKSGKTGSHQRENSDDAHAKSTRRRDPSASTSPSEDEMEPEHKYSRPSVKHREVGALKTGENQQSDKSGKFKPGVKVDTKPARKATCVENKASGYRDKSPSSSGSSGSHQHRHHDVKCSKTFAHVKHCYTAEQRRPVCKPTWKRQRDQKPVKHNDKSERKSEKLAYDRQSEKLVEVEIDNKNTSGYSSGDNGDDEGDDDEDDDATNGDKSKDKRPDPKPPPENEVGETTPSGGRSAISTPWTSEKEQNVAGEESPGDSMENSEPSWTLEKQLKNQLLSQLESQPKSQVKIQEDAQSCSYVHPVQSLPAEILTVDAVKSRELLSTGDGKQSSAPSWTLEFGECEEEPTQVGNNQLLLALITLTSNLGVSCTMEEETESRVESVVEESLREQWRKKEYSCAISVARSSREAGDGCCSVRSVRQDVDAFPMSPHSCCSSRRYASKKSGDLELSVAPSVTGSGLDEVKREVEDERRGETGEGDKSVRVVRMDTGSAQYQYIRNST